MSEQSDFGLPASLLASFFSENSPPNRSVILTGPSGSGKTTWCFRLAELARSQGVETVGLASAAVFTGGRKTGIDLYNLASGEHRPLAVRRAESSEVTGPSVEDLVTSDWQFFPETLAWGNQILNTLAARSLQVGGEPTGTPGNPKRNRSILFIDELGPLELVRGQGLQFALRLLDERLHDLACVVIRPGLLNTAQARWPWAEVLDVTAAGEVQVPEAGE